MTHTTLSAARAAALGITSTFLLALASSANAASDPLLAKTDTGVVRGAIDGDVLSFKGIPLAQPPVGELRWKPPQAPKPWSGVRDAVAYGPDCAQEPFPGDAAPLGVPAKE